MFDINNFKFVYLNAIYYNFLYNYFDVIFLYNFILNKNKQIKTKKQKNTTLLPIFYLFVKNFFFFNVFKIVWNFKNQKQVSTVIDVFTNLINMLYLLTINNKKILIIDNNNYAEITLLNNLFVNSKKSIKLDFFLNLSIKKLRKKKYRLLFKRFVFLKKIKFIFFLTSLKKSLWFFFFKKLKIPTGGLIDMNIKTTFYDYTLCVPQTNEFYKFLFLSLLYDILKLTLIENQKKKINKI